MKRMPKKKAATDPAKLKQKMRKQGRLAGVVSGKVVKVEGVEGGVSISGSEVADESVLDMFKRKGKRAFLQ